ncbi:MAG TPA: SelA-like pyridoxal phosphate-dependent enzyme, partial [Erwinia persicina]|nr:SelA-like pyridoxal phosphate-dependent enzyme [Erwinia persicina]HBI06868.1 SelA-like pyridoxal phosphate-dependent enzyme [Erwinia persicina]HBT30591.1 SelA-like pyridoxal phosphate-dependent enzyme [Erwinia persicina]
MKVGKEGILGLTHAIENYLRVEKVTGAQMVEKMTPFIDSLNQLPGIQARTVWDAAGRDIARAEIHFDEAVIGHTTSDIVQALKTGEIAIYFRGYKANEGIVEVDVRSVSADQLHTIFVCIQRLLNKEK